MLVVYRHARADATLAAKELDNHGDDHRQDLIDFMRAGLLASIDPTRRSVCSCRAAPSPTASLDFTSNMGIENALERRACPRSRLTPTGRSGSNAHLARLSRKRKTANGEGSTTDFRRLRLARRPAQRPHHDRHGRQDATPRTVYRWFATSEDNEPVDRRRTRSSAAARSSSTAMARSSMVRRATIAVERNQSAVRIAARVRSRFQPGQRSGAAEQLGDSR